MSTSAAHKVFFGHVELGDARERTPTIDFIPAVAEPRAGTDAARKHAGPRSLNAHWEISAPVVFSKTDAETGYAFWERVRTFPTDLATAATSGAGGVATWLAFVPDPLGSFTGTRNSTALTTGVSSGADQDATDDDVSSWTVGDKLLVIDDASPSTASEIVTTTSVGGGGFGATFANAHDAGSLVYRLEFYFGEAWLASPVSIPSTGHHSKANATLELQFYAVQDLISGGLG